MDKDVNNLYGKTMKQKLFVDRFGWIENISDFTVFFIKNYGDSDGVYFLKADIKYPKELALSFNNMLFLQENMKIGKTFL